MEVAAVLMRCWLFLTCTCAITSGGASAPTSELSCFWTVNVHQHTGLFNQLSPAMQDGFSEKATSIYPGSGAGNGFIGYPTELLQMLPTARATSTAPLREQGYCGTITNNTGSFEHSYSHVVAASAEACCAACAADAKCSFALHQPTNPLPSHRCWLISAKTLTPRPETGTQLLTVAGRPAPPAPPPTYWMDAWRHNLKMYPAAMAATAVTGLNGTVDGLLMIDYEPPWRPSWRFPNPNGTKQPAWETMLATIHADAIDTNFTDLVNWTVPVSFQQGSLTLNVHRSNASGF